MAFRDCRVVFKDDWVSAERGGSVLQLKAGRIQGDAGVFFPSEGGVVMGASNMILAPNIERFAARNELERALTHVRDGRAAMQRFATLLAQCHVYVLSANMRHGDRFVKVQDLAVDGGDPAMAVLTCVARIGPLLRRVPSIGNPVLVPFPALLASSPPPRFIWFNPFSPVAPRIPVSMLSRGPNSQ
jgi:hypothetical protein